MPEDLVVCGFVAGEDIAGHHAASDVKTDTIATTSLSPRLGGPGLYSALAASAALRRRVKLVAHVGSTASIPSFAKWLLDSSSVELVALADEAWPFPSYRGDINGQGDLVIRAADLRCVVHASTRVPPLTSLGNQAGLLLGPENIDLQAALSQAHQWRFVAYGVHGVWLRQFRAGVTPLLARSSLISFSEVERELLPGIEHPIWLNTIGIMTHGSKGLTVFCGEENVHVEAPSCRTNNGGTIGAGDALLGAVCGALSARSLPLTLQGVSEAVLHALAIVSTKLLSESARDFFDRCGLH